MADQHLERLTSTDAGFLHQEGPNSHMHIGGVLIFDGPPPALDDLLDHIRGRLHLIPRYRQKLARPPLEAGRPVWVDDTSFNLDYHVRNAALPAPGSFDQLLQMAARIASNRLDRTKPLWEFWLIEGLEPAEGSQTERFAMISKTHHSLIDGIAGMDLATVLFDLQPRPVVVSAEGLRPWQPRREPSPAELMLAGARGALNTAVELGVRAAAAATRPARTAEALRDAVEGVGEIVWAVLNPAPETPLNVPIGPHRRYAVVRQELSDYKLIKNRFGGTVNDVVLSVVAGALGRWLRSRGLRTNGVELRALVPVSVRTEDEHHQLGNRLTLMRAPLPVYARDPHARFDVVKTEMGVLKASKQAQGALTISAMSEIAPPAVLAQVTKLQFSTRLFNLLVTNVPGPQFPLYILGRELRDMFPIAFLPENQGLAVAIISYNEHVEYGLLADFDALPDLQVIARGIEDELADLLSAATSGTVAPAAPEAAAAAGAAAAAATEATAAARDAAAEAHAAAAAARRATTKVNEPGSDATTGTGTDDATTGTDDATTSQDRATSSEQPPVRILPSGSGRRSDGPAAEMRAKRNARTRRRGQNPPSPPPEG